LFRLVLAIYGMLFGALIASSMLGISSTIGMIVAGIVGGLIGAVVLVFAYFVGIGLIGAGIGALVAQSGWGFFRAGDPPAAAIIVLSIVGAVGAMLLQRYVIIVATAFGGAWTIIVGAVNLLATRGITRGASATEVWILYPTSTPGERWAPYAWIALGLVGVTVQLALTGKRKRL